MLITTLVLAMMVQSPAATVDRTRAAFTKCLRDDLKRALEAKVEEAEYVMTLKANCTKERDAFHKAVIALGRAAGRGAVVFGECGGYMVLGDGIVDSEGVRHEMLGALPLETSFANPKRHLGYRRLSPTPGFFWNMELSAHEFHYACTVSEGEADGRLFSVRDALGADLGSSGLRRGNVAGSFMHVIDRID